MVKSALIIGLVVLVLSAGLAYLMPICVPCLALFAGLAAGYLAGVFEKPAASGSAAKRGALAGALGGIGALLGQAIGTAIRGASMTPEQAMQQSIELMRQFGYDIPLSAYGNYETTYWAALGGTACCFGLLDLAVMAGLGALGGLLWWQISGKSKAAASSL